MTNILYYYNYLCYIVNRCYCSNSFRTYLNSDSCPFKRVKLSADSQSIIDTMHSTLPFTADNNNKNNNHNNSSNNKKKKEIINLADSDTETDEGHEEKKVKTEN